MFDCFWCLTLSTPRSRPAPAYSQFFWKHVTQHSVEAPVLTLGHHAEAPRGLAGSWSLRTAAHGAFPSRRCGAWGASVLASWMVVVA